MPSLSVVDARTEPEGLIKTTVTLPRPFLSASTTRPVILMFERNLAPAALRASSLGGSDWLCVGDSDGVVEGVAEGVGVGSEVVVGAASGFVVSVCGLSFGVLASVVTGVVVADSDGFDSVVVDDATGLEELSEVEPPVATAGLILASKPSSEPLTF